ncbi:MAG: winged helix DNA-binding domain-containing protein [Chloroflexi bacterium]|nr:winged helix DNA-binding domain-containing protein [Chloroflexota bacterium]
MQSIGPLRATPAIVPYISLWARMTDLRPSQVEAALYRDRSLVRVPAMQAKLYAIPAADLPAYYQITRPALQQGLQEYVQDILGEAGAAPAQLNTGNRAELVHRIMEVLNTRGPKTVDELAELLPALAQVVPYDGELPELGGSRLGSRLIPALCAQGLLIRAQTRGGWHSGQYSYAALSAWLPDISLESVSPEQALERVIWAYIAAFGPVTVGDVSHWLGSTPRQQIVATLRKLDDRLEHVQIADHTGDYLLVADELPALLRHNPPPGYANLLPPHDSYPTAYSDTCRFLATYHRDRIWDRTGEALGTVWVDGRVCGTWWYQLREQRIVVRFFEIMGSEAIALVGEEARRLAEFLEFSSLDVDISHYLDQDMDDDEEAGMSFAYVSLKP